ncbi:MAG TPA: sensor histidine kinase [Epulopiscium sp.]|nr:sensor histidine kinase [Candidatus Epulonipiscium sp.]
MNKITQLKYVHWVIYIINVVIITFLSLSIYKTSYQICEDFQARMFLEEAKYLPLIPSKMLMYTVYLMVCIGISNIILHYIHRKNKWAPLLLLSANIIQCIYITHYINYSYKGLFLFLIASIFLYIQWMPGRFVLLGVTLVSFIILDYDLLSVRVNLISFQNYANYHSEHIRMYLYGLKTILMSLNDIFFFLFFFLLLQSKIRENKQYIWLNDKLKDKAIELEFANEKLESYAKESIQVAKMKERNRLAREIHDILGHSLTSIATGLEACIQLLDINVEGAKGQILKIQEIAKKGLNDVRRSVKELKIDTIEKYALIPAIEKLIEEMNTFSKTCVKLTIEGEVLKLNDDEEQTVYRTVQESLTNAMRHGKAQHVAVNIVFGYYKVNITVQDDGQGCGDISKGFGLTHIGERVEMLGGTVEFISAVGKGFTTKLTIPIRWGSAYD